MAEFSSHAVLDTAGRQRKARKIATLLAPMLAHGRTLDLLEIGTGSGAIASHFGTAEAGRFAVRAIDVADQRHAVEGYEFSLYDGVRVPAADASFDVVVSNHVIEHVGGREAQAAHLREIARVLRPAGVAYLATPSRWQFMEPHFRLPGLSWVPRGWRDAYVRAARRGDRYDCDPMSHRELEQAVRSAGMEYMNRNAEALLALRDAEGTRGLAALATRLPAAWLLRAYRWSPTMVYLLRRHAAK